VSKLKIWITSVELVGLVWNKEIKSPWWTFACDRKVSDLFDLVDLTERFKRERKHSPDNYFGSEQTWILKYIILKIFEEHGSLYLGSCSILESSLKLSQKEFADKLSITPSSLCDLEKGRKVPEPKRAALVLKSNWPKNLRYLNSFVQAMQSCSLGARDFATFF